MNFEYLVQRYIDGEITPSEDLQLQQLMKDSPYLRSQFDQIVHIQYAYTQSTKPILNEKDSAAIFDTLKVAMVASIASTAHAPMTTTSLYVGVSNFILPVLLSLFFILSPNNATTPLLKYVAYQQSTNLKNTATNSATVGNLASTTRNVNNSINRNSKLLNNATENSSIDNSSVAFLADNQQNPTTKPDISNNFITELSSVPENVVSTDVFAETPNDFMMPQQIVTTNLFDNSSNQSLQPSVPFVSYNTPIKVEFVLSATSNNFNSLGSIRTTPILSQYVAINYGIDVKNRFGIEFGSTSFVGLAYGAITKPQGTEVDYGSGVQSATSSNDQDPIETPIDNSKIKPTNQSKYNCEDIEYRKNIQIFQSSVFYERELFETSFLSVNSRVGVGVTNIGVTSYTKTLLEVKPNDNFSIFGGAEYRVLTGNAGSALQQSTTSASMLSIQTGITIKF
jgi:hypothetical protein